MLKEEIQSLLASSGFCETLNRNSSCTTHMMHYSSCLKKLVEYYVDRVGVIRSLWGFQEDSIIMFENKNDFELWLKQ